MYRHLAVLGALASLLALAYGPFIQNLVVIRIDYINPQDTAELAISRDYRYNSKDNLGMSIHPLCTAADHGD